MTFHIDKKYFFSNLKILIIFNLFPSSSLHSLPSSPHARLMLSTHTPQSLTMLQFTLLPTITSQQSLNTRATQQSISLMPHQSHMLMLPIMHQLPSTLPHHSPTLTTDMLTMHMLITHLSSSPRLKPHTPLPTVDQFTPPHCQDMPSLRLASIWPQHQELIKSFQVFDTQSKLPNTPLNYDYDKTATKFDAKQ